MARKGITASSTAEYFSKNLQQVGFSSPTKAVLTTLKEAVDNSLDACDEHGILPQISVVIEKLGPGALRNTDQILVRVDDNGPGIPFKEIPQVFGEYLASSKFGRGRCTRGQQGIGISAATTWAMQTTARGVKVISKVKKQPKAVSCFVEVDLKNNKGVARDRQDISWDRPHGTSVEFVIDGRLQMNGEAGLVAFLKANVLVNPHLSLRYKLPDSDEVIVDRVSKELPTIPEATEPHPHTMKLGEFLAHGKLFSGTKVRDWLKKGFSRIGDSVIEELKKSDKLNGKMFDTTIDRLSEAEVKQLYSVLQQTQIMAPSTRSVLSIGEESLAKSIQRIGEIDFFSVVTRKPSICDFKPVQIEVALARLKERQSGDSQEESDQAVQVLRFANRVPLQFDKAGCAIVKAIQTVNWKAYGLRQPGGNLPSGPYIFAVSVVSPFIKFKNASKETIEASDELVDELRKALIQGGQRLSRHLRKEHREALLEDKIQHIERFAPILVETLCRITEASDTVKVKAEEGLLKILGRDTKAAKAQLADAEVQLSKHLEQKRKRLGNIVPGMDEENDDGMSSDEGEEPEEDAVEEKATKSKKKAKARKRPGQKKAKTTGETAKVGSGEKKKAKKVSKPVKEQAKLAKKAKKTKKTKKTAKAPAVKKAKAPAAKKAKAKSRKKPK